MELEIGFLEIWTVAGLVTEAEREGVGGLQAPIDAGDQGPEATRQEGIDTDKMLGRQMLLHAHSRILILFFFA